MDNIGTLTPLDGEPPAIGGVLIRAPSFCPHGRGNASCGFTSRSKRGFPPASRFDSGHGMLHLCGMLWRLRAFPDFCEPSLPSQVERPPSGRAWVHEIKHDGFRLLARRRAERVRLFTRNGHDWSERFPLIVEALYELKATTCLLDGEAITCTEAGLAEFEGLRSRRGDVHFCAFDLLELDGQDLRLEPLLERRRLLAQLVRKPRSGLVLNAQFEQDGPLVFEHACLLGCEGIVSKRKNSRYRSGRSRDWVKSKNPAAPAVKREAEEDWSKHRWR